MTLTHAKANTVYNVLAVAGAGNTRRRLLDMGFTPACKLFVAATAPTGGTVLVRLRGFSVALREDAASLIELTAERQ
ncbi:MAG: ferrous iron transport protein A [Clostridia bacterium]|nr:ferrous iron transport protein A [Clostridia bacterium]